MIAEKVQILFYKRGMYAYTRETDRGERGQVCYQDGKTI